MNIDDVLNEAIQLNKAHRRFLRPTIADLLYHPTQRHYEFPLGLLDDSTFEITERDEREISNFDSYVSDRLYYQTLQPEEFYSNDWDVNSNDCIRCNASTPFGTYWCKNCDPMNSYTHYNSDYAPLLSLNDLNFDDEGFPIPERNNNISYVSPYRDSSYESFYNGIGRFK